VVVQSIWTALSAALFVGVVLWALSRGAGSRFGEAERLPFADEESDDLPDAGAVQPIRARKARR
jgi:cbb3-type cytochrome oxidase subunit 3